MKPVPLLLGCLLAWQVLAWLWRDGGPVVRDSSVDCVRSEPAFTREPAVVDVYDPTRLDHGTATAIARQVIEQTFARGPAFVAFDV